MAKTQDVPLPAGALTDSATITAYQGRIGDIRVYAGTFAGRPARLLEFWPLDTAVRHGNSISFDSQRLKAIFRRARKAFMAQSPQLEMLSSPHTTTVLGGFFAAETAWRVEEAGGEPVSKLLQAGASASPRLVVRVARATAQALKTAHAAGLTHLDVAAESLVQNGDRILLGAFSVDRRELLSVVDTPQRLLRQGQTALELGDPTATESLGPETDIYALGALLYRMICGRPPEAPNLRADDSVNWPHGARAAYPAAFLEAVSQTLAIEPENRPGNLDDLIATIPDIPPPNTAASPRTPGKGRGQAPVWIGLTLLLIGGAALYGVSQNRSPTYSESGSAAEDAAAAAADAAAEATVAWEAPEGCEWGMTALVCGGQVIERHGLELADVTDAAANKVPAMTRLAAFYLQDTPARNTTRAMALLLGAAERRDAPAALGYARLLENPPAHDATAASPGEARRWYLRLLGLSAHDFDNLTDAHRREARTRLLALEPAFWSGQWTWDTDQPCFRLDMSAERVDIIATNIRLTGAIDQNRREPGQVIYTTGDLDPKEVRLTLEEAGDAMMLAIRDLGTGVQDQPGRYIRCPS